MSEQGKQAEFSCYDALSTEELQEILRKHAHGELQTEPDTEELYYIMEVLKQRRQINEPQAFRSDEEALADFYRDHLPNKERRKRNKLVLLQSRAFKTVAAVLAVVFALTLGTVLTARAFRIDIWGKIACWTREIFHFSETPEDTTGEDPEQEYNAELKSLQDALDDHAIAEKLAPTWLPEGYKYKDLRVVESPRVLNINAIYENNGLELIINIRQTIGVPAQKIEKNEDLLEIYVIDGIEYYIFSNNTSLQAAWCIGEFECFITGKLTLEEMKEMIDSIQ